MAQDNAFLGTEKVGKLLRMFAIPCILSLVIQSFYNIVDQIFIGNAGYLPLGNTATSIVFPLTIIALAIAMWLGDGTAASISLSQGRNQSQHTPQTIGTSLSVGLLASLVIMTLSFIFVTPILQFFGATGEAALFLPVAKEYAWWIIGGFPFFILASVINPIIRTDGSPRYAMFAMSIGAVINIILDPIMIYAARLGMTGAALATFIGQAVSCLASVAYLFRLKSCRLTWRSLCPDGRQLLTIIKLGVSSFLTQFSIVIISAVNNIVLMRYFVSEVTNAQGILNVVFKIFGICISIVIGIAVGAQPILGYNYGAQKYDRVKQTLRQIILCTLVVGVVATLLFELCPELLLGLFGYSAQSGRTAAEIGFGVNAFRIYLGLIALTCLVKVLSIFFQAIGKPVNAMLLAVLRDVVFIVPLAIILPLINTAAFMWSAPIADVLTTIVAIILLVLCLRQLNRAATPATQPQAAALQPSKPGVIITIAREHGAGGHEIGEKVAKKLGIPFYDKQIALLAAEESGLSSQFISDIADQKSLLYSLYLSTQANQEALNAQAQVLRKIAAQGACVIVGRAADYVLQDCHPYRVFVYASPDFKVARLQQNYGDTPAQAKTNFQKADRRRAQFYQTVTGQKWTDRNNYDLVVDSSTIGIDKVVDLICTAVQDH